MCTGEYVNTRLKSMKSSEPSHIVSKAPLCWPELRHVHIATTSGSGTSKPCHQLTRNIFTTTTTALPQVCAHTYTQHVCSHVPVSTLRPDSSASIVSISALMRACTSSEIKSQQPCVNKVYVTPTLPRSLLLYPYPVSLPTDLNAWGIRRGAQNKTLRDSTILPYCKEARTLFAFISSLTCADD